MAKATFTELFRIPVSDVSTLVVSSVIEDGLVKGYSVNSYITTERYTGFTKATFIPADKLIEFKEKLSHVHLN